MTKQSCIYAQSIISISYLVANYKVKQLEETSDDNPLPWNSRQQQAPTDHELMKASPSQATGKHHTVTCALKNEACDQAN